MAAEDMLSVQEAFHPDAIARLERDLQTVGAAIAAHLHGKCGYYRVVGNDADEINAGMQTYRDCMVQWDRNGRALIESFGADVLQATERIDAFMRIKKEVDAHLCSKMPKKSTCVSDSLYAWTEAAFAVNPKRKITNGEIARINGEVRAFNASVSRQNGLIKTANFFQALADALSSQ